MFRAWLEDIDAWHVVGIAGNHDFIFDKAPGNVQALDLPWTYLQDSQVEVEGLTIYGTPWVPNLPRWAFHGGMDSRVWNRFERIPEGIDILMSHGPMDGYGDVVGPMFGGPLHVGCKTMRAEVRRIKPKVFICGHIHEGHGHYEHPSIEHGIYNVAYLNEHYEPVNPIITLPL